MEPALQGPLSNPNDPNSPPVDEPAHTFYVHVAHLTGLQPGATYGYAVVTGGGDLTASSQLSFHTDAGESDSTLRALVFGDSGTGLEGQLTLRNQMLGRPFDLAIHTGDVAYYYGSYYELEHYFFSVYKELVSRIPFFLAIGNHDYETLGGQPFFDDFYLPDNATPASAAERYYSFDYGPVHFVAIDTEILSRYGQAPQPAEDMLSWLTADLSATEQPWTIVFLHKPPYSSTNVQVNPYLARLPPIFEQRQVDLVLTGHDHDYTRTLPMKDGATALLGEGGIVYVTSGGGGGGYHLCQPRPYTAVCRREYHFLDLSVLDDCRLSYDAIDRFGELIDHFELDRCDPDSDNDGTVDSADAIPLVSDTDGDGLPDLMETAQFGTNPNVADTDGDGLSDGLEINNWRTAPLDVDTDNDGYSDGVEAFAGSNPLDRNSVPFIPPTSTPTGQFTPTPTATRTVTLARTPTPSPTRTATVVGLSGDVNCDGTRNSIDAALVLQRSAGLLGSLPCPQNAHVNDDGRVDAIDAALILQFVAGLLDNLPP